MKIFIFICMLAILLPQSEQTYSATLFKSGYTIIDFEKLTNDEKLTALHSAKINELSVIIFSDDLGIEIQDIIAIYEDRIEVESLNHWWWNRPRSRHSIVKQKISPLESTPGELVSSNPKVIFIDNIIAIQIEEKRSVFGSLSLVFPIILILLIMFSLGLFGTSDDGGFQRPE